MAAALAAAAKLNFGFSAAGVVVEVAWAMTGFSGVATFAGSGVAVLLSPNWNLLLSGAQPVPRPKVKLPGLAVLLWGRAGLAKMSFSPFEPSLFVPQQAQVVALAGCRV